MFILQFYFYWDFVIVTRSYIVINLDFSKKNSSIASLAFIPFFVVQLRFKDQNYSIFIFIEVFLSKFFFYKYFVLLIIFIPF